MFVPVNPFQVIADVLFVEARLRASRDVPVARPESRRVGRQHLVDQDQSIGVLPGAGQNDDRLILIDEVLTPDSSRFWPRDGYVPGGAQPSFDKQYVRDYLERIRWNKQPPVPSLPDDVVLKTREKYVEAFRRLTGRELE